MRLSALAVCVSLLLAAPSASASPERPHCVGWAIGGAVVGLAVGYYAVVGLSELGGRSLLTSDARVGDVAAVLAGETLGMTLGPVAACAFSRDPRRVPAASFVIAGAIVGATSLGAPYFSALAQGFRPFGDEGDNPVGTALLGVALVSAGGLFGTWIGWRLHLAREPESTALWSSPRWAVVPMLHGGAAGLGIIGAL